MTQPLALVLYERLLPGSQLVNRLHDLKYRVHVISDPERLTQLAEELKPMVVLVDLESGRPDVYGATSHLRQNAGTRHLPIIGIAADNSAGLHNEAQSAGITLLVNETSVLTHLPQFLEQALQIE